MPWRAFDIRWFERWQDVLYFLLNAPVVKWWSRWILRINGERSSVGRKRIQAVLPHAIYWLEDDGQIAAEFRTHPKFAKRVYYAFKWVWWTLHFFDWLILDRWFPQFAFGFAILTEYPDADPETTTVDGTVWQSYSAGSGVSWSTIRAASGSGATDDAPDDHLYYHIADTGAGNWQQLERSIFLFDTSSIGSGMTITGATFSVYGVGKNNYGVSGADHASNVYSSAPASNTALASGDYDSIGSTPYCDTAITYTAYSTVGFNDWAFNSTGLAGITKGGVTKLGVRDATYDVSGSAPTWSSGLVARQNMDTADYTGTSQDPKLVVVYNDGSGFVDHIPAVEYGDDTNTPGTNISSSLKVTMPGSGAYEISEIGLFVWADPGQTMTFRLSIWTYDAVNDCPESMVSNSESSELSTSSNTVTRVSHTYSTRPVLTGGTDYLLAYFMGTDYGNVDNLLPGYSDAGVWTSAATYPTWPTGAQWEAANESTEDASIYALYVNLDYTHTGTISGAGYVSGQRTIEKVKQGAISGAGYAGATRTIEKVIPGAFQGVGYAISDMAYIPAPYTTVQEGYRFRDNDGNEAAATFLGTQDVAYQGPSGSIRRLRFVINSTGDPASQQFQVEWRWAGGSTWRKLIQ